MEWDSMRLSLRLGQRRAALSNGLAILSRWQRIIGVAILLRERFFERRMSASVGRDGRPSVALLVRKPEVRHAVTATLHGRTIRDLSADPAVRALLRLVRRPAGLVVVESHARAALFRGFGVRAVTARRVLASGNVAPNEFRQADGDEHL